jgi:hypothetical protein
VKQKTAHTGRSSTTGIVRDRTRRSIVCRKPNSHQPAGSPATYASIPGGVRRVVGAEEPDVERQRGAQPLDESPRPLLRAAAVAALPGRVRLVVPAHDADQLVVVHEPLEEARRVRAVVALAADACRALPRAVLERVVDERRESQAAPLLGRRRLALDVGEDVADVVLDGALGVAAPSLAPLDPATPLRVGGDAALQVGLELERQLQGRGMMPT